MEKKILATLIALGMSGGIVWASLASDQQQLQFDQASLVIANIQLQRQDIMQQTRINQLVNKVAQDQQAVNNDEANATTNSANVTNSSN